MIIHLTLFFFLILTIELRHTLVLRLMRLMPIMRPRTNGTVCGNTFWIEFVLRTMQCARRLWPPGDDSRVQSRLQFLRSRLQLLQSRLQLLWKLVQIRPREKNRWCTSQLWPPRGGDHGSAWFGGGRGIDEHDNDGDKYL